MGLILLFLAHLSSGFAPVETMPGWLQGLAHHQPTTSIIDASRALMSGGAPGADAWIGILWCLGFNAVAVWIVAVVFPRKVAR